MSADFFSNTLLHQPLYLPFYLAAWWKFYKNLQCEADDDPTVFVLVLV